MKLPQVLSLMNLIGALLVAVALVSAGGLVYISSEYSKISDTYVSVDAGISALRLTHYNASGEVIVVALVTLDNPSNLDIEIYGIECNTYFDRYVGWSTGGQSNGTVKSGTLREVQVFLPILPNTDFMDRLDFALGGDQLYAYVFGFLWFRIADYPDVGKRLPIYYLGPAVMQNA